MKYSLHVTLRMILKLYWAKLSSLGQPKSKKINNVCFLTSDLPEEMLSDFSEMTNHLPMAKATIVETATLVVATRIRSDDIEVQPMEAFVYSKSYGEESELKISFPAGVVEKKCRLSVQVRRQDL